MEIFFGVGNLLFGILLLLIGFKVYNPFKGKNEVEKEAIWYSKFGLLFKIGGVLVFLFGLFKTIGNL